MVGRQPKSSRLVYLLQLLQPVTTYINQLTFSETKVIKLSNEPKIEDCCVWSTVWGSGGAIKIKPVKPVTTESDTLNDNNNAIEVTYL